MPPRAVEPGKLYLYDRGFSSFALLDVHYHLKNGKPVAAAHFVVRYRPAGTNAPELVDARAQTISDDDRRQGIVSDRVGRFVSSKPSRHKLGDLALREVLVEYESQGERKTLRLITNLLDVSAATIARALSLPLANRVVLPLVEVLWPLRPLNQSHAGGRHHAFLCDGDRRAADVPASGAPAEQVPVRDDEPGRQRGSHVGGSAAYLARAGKTKRAGTSIRGTSPRQTKEPSLGPRPSDAAAQPPHAHNKSPSRQSTSQNEPLPHPKHSQRKSHSTHPKKSRTILGIASATRCQWVAVFSTYALTFSSSTSSGTAPSPSTTSWNSRTSKRRAEPLFGHAPQRADLQLAHLVGRGLAGPGDVAVHLGRDVVQRQGRVVGHELDGLLPGPAQVVHAGVDDQPAGPPHLVAQPAEVAVGVLVEADLEAEPLGVQAPAFDERRGVREAAKRRQPGQLLLQARSACDGPARPRAATGPRSRTAAGS